MHENAGNIGFRLDFYQTLFSKLDVNIVTFAYRGYSDSEGHPTEEGIKLDAAAMVRYIESEPLINPDKVFLYGRSLGGAVAIHAINEHPHAFRGLIVENTFTSMGDMVDKIFFFVRHLKWLILRNHWRSADLIGKVTHPIFFIAGNQDELVPP